MSCSASSCGCDDRKPWEETTVIGIRGSYLSVRGPERAHTLGLAFAGSSEQYKTDGLLALRGSSAFQLGGGSGGFEGQLAGAFAVGARGPVGATHGPVGRIGLGGELLGNDKFYYSHLELPIVEVGYQVLEGRNVVEIGGRIAPVLTGRYNTGDSQRRELGTSFEGGGYVALHSAFGRIDASYTRIEARKTDPGTPVDVLRGSACAYVGVVALCGDAMYVRGDQAPPALPVVTGPTSGPPAAIDPEAKSLYAGVTLGLVGL